jgi:NAD(P)-dependent dehydrogenase (short-subunit alcohol dehydrogenase family)
MASLIITGANGNLGVAVVNRLLKDGYNIIAASGHGRVGNLQDHKNLDSRQVDLSDEDQARNFVKTVLQLSPDIQAAVLLVGGFAMGKLADTNKAELDKMISLNFYTAYHLVRPLLSHFLSRPQGGQIILVGSRPGLNASDGKDFFAYSMSKAMIFKLAEFINAEGKDKGVTATVIVPSTIDTEANRKSMPNADFSKWVPAGNIADAISFSLSETGRMMRESLIKVYNRS